MPFDPTLRQIIAGLRNSREWDEELDLRLLQSLWPQLVGSSLAESTAAVAIDRHARRHPRSRSDVEATTAVHQAMAGAAFERTVAKRMDYRYRVYL